MRSPRILRRLAAVTGAAAVALALTVVPAGAATAADGGTGWVRVAHLSPDTKHVDVRLAAVSGGGKVIELRDVAYGAVSKYMSLKPGTYAVAMRPAGADDDAPPVVQTSVEVADHTASTVAVFGRNASLKTKVVDDDLTPPSGGHARARLVQASTAGGPVTITSSDGTLIARDAALASVSHYSAVPAGTWRLTTVQGDKHTNSSVSLKQGQVVSLFVLDTSNGSTVVRPVVDSSGVGATPNGYLATGGGYLAHRAAAEGRLLEAGGVGALLAGAIAGAGALVLRRRHARA